MAPQTVNDRLDAIDYDRLVDLVAERIAEDLAPGNRICQEYGFVVLDDPEEAGSLDPRRPEHAAGFGPFLRRKAEEELSFALDRLVGEVTLRPDGRIELWRELVVPRDWPERGVRERPIGVCWAFDEEGAEAHHGAAEGPDTLRVVVRGAVGLDGVDWVETAVLNAASEYTVGDEREIRLLPDARVEILGLGVRRGHARARPEPIPAGHLAGLLFVAGEPCAESLDPSCHDAVHEAARAVTGRFGLAGAGCVVMARSTGRMLLPLRSDEVDEPGTYGTWGGAIDPGLDPLRAALRELAQESGYRGPCEVAPLKPYDSGTGFTFHNFLVLVDDEFTPILNEETARAAWTEVDEMPEPLHFGLAALLDDPESLRLIREAAGLAAAPAFA